uniref:Ig-like domain-containing protein n=1 Tax=Malurus cyaneus samueli TaxID=2593467 RepID=A0A8C5U771_9PASS
MASSHSWRDGRDFLSACKPWDMTIFPAVLTLPEGDKATFFCNISMENDSGSEYRLNWYKVTNHSQAQKIAEISRNNSITKTEKYRLTNHTPVFEIEILNLHKNDSGSFYCGLITFCEPDKVMESNRSQLMVTENLTWVRRAQPCPVPSPLWACVGAGGYVCMLDHHDGLTLQKEEKPPVVSISTLDYGELEFQRGQCTPVPFETRLVEQTEYATIIFPEQKPVTPERSKKHLDERT